MLSNSVEMLLPNLNNIHQQTTEIWYFENLKKAKVMYDGTMSLYDVTLTLNVVLKVSYFGRLLMDIIHI